MKATFLRFAFYMAVVTLCLSGCSGGHGNKTIVVAITGAPATIAPNGTATLTATVSNDSAEAGVTWTVTGSGTYTSTTTTLNYTAPATVPSTPTVTVTATSITDTTKSATASFTIANATSTACQPSPALRGNESALTQPVAFVLKGSDGNDEPIGYAGSFTPNGSGTLTAADLDIVSFQEELGQEAVDLSNSSYSYGSDGRGCLYLSFNPVNAGSIRRPASIKRNRAHVRHGQKAPLSIKSKRRKFAALASADADSVVFAFSFLSLAGSGRIIEFDNTAGTGTISAGQMHAQTPSAASPPTSRSEWTAGSSQTKRVTSIGWRSPAASPTTAAISPMVTQTKTSAAPPAAN